LTDIFDNESLYHWSTAFCRYFELLFSKKLKMPTESPLKSSRYEE
jgi:hypothetical protein